MFGCKCYAHIPKATRENTSLGQHAFQGYFLGFADQQIKSALILNPLKTGSKINIVDYENILYDEIVEPRRIIDSGELVFSDLDEYNIDLKNVKRLRSSKEGGEDSFEQDISLNQSSPCDSLPNKNSSKISEPLRRSERILAQSFTVSKSKNNISLSEAMRSTNRSVWEDAMRTELLSIENNDVWFLSIYPSKSGQRVLRLQWILTIKRDEFGNELSKKARLVVLGNLALPGVDYQETYAPVSKLPSIRVFFSIAAQFNMHLHQVDVKVAFQNADIDEDIYVYAPEYYHLVNPDVRPGSVLKLNRALYGLPQAPRQWFKTVDAFLKELGYQPFSYEPCMYSKKMSDGGSAIMILYVDDMVFGNTSKRELDQVIQAFKTRFRITDLGQPRKLLGMRVSVGDGLISLDTEYKIEQLAKEYGLTRRLCQLVPILPNIKFHHASVKQDREISHSDQLSTEESKKYRSIVGAIMFIMTATRPDIAYAVSILARYLSNPFKEHMEAAKGLISYLYGSRSLKLIYRKIPMYLYRLVAYTDSDWAANLENRRSHSSGIIFLGKTPIFWLSTLQSTVALSTAEAEINALKEIVKAVLWIRGILRETGLFSALEPTEIYEDNQAAIEIVQNPEVSKRNRHYDMSYHFIRENLQEFKNIIISYVESADNIADIGTKPLQAMPFIDKRTKMLSS
jgi:hypothetical protein